MAKICPYPFSRIEFNPDYYIPCCFDWLDPSYIKLDHSGKDKWNSKAAQELRKRILKGDYSLCQTQYCKPDFVDLEKLDQLQSPVETADYVLDQERLQAIKSYDFDHYGPSSISITADRRCNLACESCRPEKVLHLTPRDQSNVDQTLYHIEKYKKDLTAIKMVGDGEVFFSPFLSKFLKQLNPADYPSLQKVFLLTNGTLFTPQAYESHMPGIQYVDTVSVSIDAGTQECYHEVRGGNWNRLQENLKFISELRKSGHIRSFIITFVTRKKNYQTMKQFYHMGVELAADEVVFTAFHPWANIAPHINYKDQAIHEQQHPEHDKLQDTIEQLRELDKERHILDVRF